jgi:hypothetical protein
VPVIPRPRTVISPCVNGQDVESLHSSPIELSDGKRMIDGQSADKADVLARSPGGQPPSQGSIKAANR